MPIAEILDSPPSILPGGVATMLTGERDAEDRVAALSRFPGFAGAALLRAVGPSRKSIAYVRWTEAAFAAESGGGSPLRATDVRLRSAPLDRKATLPITAGGVVLALRWEVEPACCDALLAELRTFTDAYLPSARGVIATAFHVSDDCTVVAEYLQARGVWPMIKMQFGRKMRRHQRAVDELVKATDVGLYRVSGIVGG